ncbi:hypothetical protein JCGZ_23932 [Jatropha curcas]|uniref:Uncharacterized protein n=1 Tax=Jatropha curcas TaxID=180498 RepID=A0A067JPH4_JATCU|nr:hypothetical protein JCGZ_23932 [Jatropha curcas]
MSVAVAGGVATGIASSLSFRDFPATPAPLANAVSPSSSPSSPAAAAARVRCGSPPLDRWQWWQWLLMPVRARPATGSTNGRQNQAPYEISSLGVCGSQNFGQERFTGRRAGGGPATGRRFSGEEPRDRISSLREDRGTVAQISFGTL